MPLLMLLHNLLDILAQMANKMGLQKKPILHFYVPTLLIHGELRDSLVSRDVRDKNAEDLDD
jgi:hypothetical protein